MRNVRVFDADLTGVIPRIMRPAGMSKASEQRVSRRMRDELRDVLNKVVLDAFNDGAISRRSGTAFNAMRYGGVRVFGTTFNSLRGHIMGPAYIRLLEEGGEITPSRTQYLAIPMDAALRPDGTPKLPSPRSWANIGKTSVTKKSAKTGRRYIVFRRNGKTTFLYVLVDSVEFEGRGFLNRAWNENKGRLIVSLGQFALAEWGRTDLGALARISTGGRRRR